MARRGKCYLKSCLICLKCGCKMPILRRMDALRGKNHIKTMYCFCCKTEGDFIENYEEVGSNSVNTFKTMGN